MAALTSLSRRRWLARTAAVATLPFALPLLAQTAPEAPVIGAPKIIDALTLKDVALDQPGAARGRPRRRTDPAIDLQVQFGFDSADLLPQGRRQLDQLAMALNDRVLSGATFVLAGHTDLVGDFDYNLRLSQARADSVKAYLMQFHAISAERLQTIGYGFSCPIDPQHPTAAVNRRVEVRRISGQRADSETGAGFSDAPPATMPSSDRLVPTPR